MKILTERNVLRLFDQFNGVYINEPTKFSVRGFLKNITKKILDYDVYVDRWPNYGTVIAKPRESQEMPFYRLGIYSDDQDTLKHMLCQPGFLPHNVPIRIYGLPFSLLPAVEETVKILGYKAKYLSRDDPRNIFYLPLEGNVLGENYAQDFITHMQNNLPDNLHMTHLDPVKDTEAIASSWMKYFNWSDYFITKDEGEKAIIYCLDCGVSTGIYRKSDNKLLAWMLEDLDTHALMGITLPECRGKNMLSFVLAEYWRQEIESGVLHWGYTASTNKAGTAFVNARGACYFDNFRCLHCILRPRTSNI